MKTTLNQIILNMPDRLIGAKKEIIDRYVKDQLKLIQAQKEKLNANAK